MRERLCRAAARVLVLGDRRAAVLAVAAGGGAALAFAPFYLVPLIFISFPVLVLLIDRARDSRAALVSGWWFGLGYFLVGLYWVGNSFLAQDDVPKWGGVLAALALAMALALFVAFAAWLAKFFWTSGWRRVPLFAASFATAEWLRGHLFTGFPWNLQANIWGWSDQMTQSVSLMGSYGLGLLTVFAAASFVLLAADPDKKTSILRASILRTWGLPALSLGILGALFIFGAVRLNGAETLYHPDVRMRIVQANIPQIEKWRRENWRDNFVRHIGLSINGNGGLDGITHVIWPETAVPYFIGSEPSRRHLLARALGNSPVVITGAPRFAEGAERPAYYNAVQVIGAEAELLASYDKAHLVPFGEYLPFRRLLNRLGLKKLTAGAVDFSPGPGLSTITIPGLPPFGPLVCYEVIFPGRVVADEERPRWLLNLTNDAWFGNSPGPYQHLVMTRFRAAEEGLPVIRAAGTGISAVIGPYGRVLDSIGLNRQGVMDTGLPMALDSIPPYGRFGDLLFALMVILGFAARLSLFGRDVPPS